MAHSFAGEGLVIIGYFLAMVVTLVVTMVNRIRFLLAKRRIVISSDDWLDDYVGATHKDN